MKLFLKNSNLCDHNSPTSQTDGRTDGQTDDMRSQYCTALCTKVHRAVKINVAQFFDSQCILAYAYPRALVTSYWTSLVTVRRHPSFVIRQSACQRATHGCDKYAIENSPLHYCLSIFGSSSSQRHHIVAVIMWQME